MSSLFSAFIPNHVKLVNACYPSSSALLASDSTCEPLAQELSQLVSYASSRARRLVKLSRVLEQRAGAEARKAGEGNARARVQLLVTLSIFKALANECRRDIDVFSTALLSTTKDSLACLPKDLKLQARVANLFAIWAAYTNGNLIGPDKRCTNYYIYILKIFQDRCTVTGKDLEPASGTQMIGLAAITAVISSNAFFLSREHLSKQVAIVISALLHTLHEADSIITEESKVVSADPSATVSRVPSHPLMNRRAASIHTDVDGEHGPERSDVVNASLRAFQALLRICNTAQVSIIFDSILQHIDQNNLWENAAVGKWYAEHVIEWTRYQYRYSVPTLLVDKLLGIQDSPSSAKHLAIVEMLTFIFTSPIPLINLSILDIISSLVTVLLRRISIGLNDPLLLPLVECVSSLGTHVYYADQIPDLTEHIVDRIAVVQTNGLAMQGQSCEGPAREVALRCLVSCLSGIPKAADTYAAQSSAKLMEDHFGIDNSISIGTRATQRNKVEPEAWQETLTLLCEPNYATRAMYARGLAAFIRKEIEQEPFVQCKEKDVVEVTEGSRRYNVEVVVNPELVASLGSSYLNTNSISRFLNALYAVAFSLAMASWNSESKAIKAQPSPKDKQDEKQPTMLNRLTGDQIPKPTLSDFSLLLQILTCTFQRVPCRAVLTGVPMILALAHSSRELEDATHHAGRLRAIREVLCHLWIVIGEVWDIPDIVKRAHTALTALRQTILPPLSDVSPTRLNLSEEPVHFPSLVDPLWPKSRGMADTGLSFAQLTRSAKLQAITGLNEYELSRRLRMEWTVEGAVKDSIKQTLMWDILRSRERTFEPGKHRIHRNSTNNSFNQSGGEDPHGLTGAISRLLTKSKSSFSPPKSKNRMSKTSSQSLDAGKNEVEEDQGSGSGSGEMSYAESRNSLGSQAGRRSDQSSHHSASSRPVSAGPVLPSSSNSRLSEILASIEKSSRSRQASIRSASSSSQR